MNRDVATTLPQRIALPTVPRGYSQKRERSHEAPVRTHGRAAARVSRELTARHCNPNDASPPRFHGNFSNIPAAAHRRKVCAVRAHSCAVYTTDPAESRGCVRARPSASGLGNWQRPPRRARRRARRCGAGRRRTRRPLRQARGRRGGGKAPRAACPRWDQRSACAARACRRDGCTCAGVQCLRLRWRIWVHDDT